MIKTLLVVSIMNAAFLFMCSKDSGVNTQAAAVSGKAGSTARFTIVGNYLYALDGKDVLSYDISNGAAPVFKNRTTIAFDIETIYPYNNMLFIGGQMGMYAYGLTDPAKPNKLSEVRHVRSCDPVVVQGNYAYVTLRGGNNCGAANVLNVYDVTNVFNPLLVKSININAPFGLGINGNALYVTNPSGIKVFNVTSSTNPIVVSDIAEPTASDVIPYNNTLIVQLARGVGFYDIGNSLQPTFVSRITQ